MAQQEGWQLLARPAQRGGRHHTRPAGSVRGQDDGGVRAVAMYTLIGTAKLNNVDPQAWLADVLDSYAKRSTPCRP